MKILIIFLLFLIYLINPNIAFGQNEATNTAEIKVNYESINPDSILYPMKRLWEKTEEKLPWTDRKKFLESQLDRRFKELYYVAKEKKLSQFEIATNRFNTSIGQLNDVKNTDLNLKERAKNYQISLKNLKTTYEEFAYTNLLQQAEESLGGLISKF